MDGMVRLVLAQARRDRIILPAWILSIAALGFAVAAAVSTEFADEADRAAIINVAAVSPAFLFIRGLPDGTEIGAVVFFQGYAFTAVLAGLMSTFLIIRHTRTDEELGRAELIGAGSVPRAAPLAATLVLGAAANVLLALCLAAGFAAAGLPGPGAATAAAAVGAVGVFFVAVAAAVAQVMPSGRAANGAAAGLVGVAYFLRGIGDASGTASPDLTSVTSGWASLLSPIGWGQRTRPFSAADPAPVLVIMGAAAALALAVLLVRTGRDLDAHLLPERAGPERSSARGDSFLRLAWSQQRPTLIGWCLFGALLGGIAGGLGPLVGDLAGGNESLRDFISRLAPGGRAEIMDVFTTAMLGISGVLAAAAGIQAVLRLRADEAEGRVELLLSTPRSRARWFGANLVLAVLSVLSVVVSAGTAATLGLALTGTADARPFQLVGAALAHSPAAAVFVALTALLFAALPRWSVAAGWCLLVAGLVLGQFGELLRLPVWLQDVSPFRHSAAMPFEPFDPAAAVGLSTIAVGVAGVAAYLLRRRDLPA